MLLRDAAPLIISSPMVVAVDTETSGLRWYRDMVGVVSFAWGDGPDESVATRNVDLAVAVLQERMDNGLPVVLHNSPFDLHFLSSQKALDLHSLVAHLFKFPYLSKWIIHNLFTAL